MKKFLCLALLFLFGLQSAMLAQDEYVSLTFTRATSTNATIESVTVKDQNSQQIAGLNATVELSPGQKTNNSNIPTNVICPGGNDATIGNVGNGAVVSITFTISGADSFTFNKVGLGIHSLSNTDYQQANRYCDVIIEQGTSSSNLSNFTTLTDINIYAMSGENAKQAHYRYTDRLENSFTKAQNGDLVIKLTMEAGSSNGNNGFFFGLEELRLYKAPAENNDFTFSSLADIKGTKVVRIVTDRADGKVLAEESNKVYLRDYVEGDETQMWEIVSSGSEYQIRNKATGCYIDRGTGTSTSAMPTNASSRNYNIPQAAGFTDARPLYNFFHPSTTVNCLYYDGTTDKLQIAALTADAEGYAFGLAVADDFYNAPTPDLNEILATNHGLVRLYSNRFTSKVAMNDDDNMKVAAGDAAGTTTPSQIWLVEALAGGGYTLRSMSTGKYVQTVDDNNTSYPLGDEGATLYIQPSTARTSAFVISTTSTFDNNTCFHHDGSDRVVRWHASDLPSAWSIEPATDADYDELMAQFEPTTPPVEPATDLSTILATNHGLVRLYSNVDETKVAANENNQMKVVVGDAAGTTTSSQIWLIEALDGGGYSLRNMGTGKYVQVAGTTQGTQYSLGNAAATFYITAATKTEKANDFLISSDASCEGMNCLFDNNEGQIVVGHSTEEASAWAVVAATDADYDALLEALTPTEGRTFYYKIRSKAYSKLITEEAWDNSNIKGIDDADLSRQYWKFTENEEGQWTIQSVTSKRYVQADPGESEYFQLGMEPAYFVLDEVVDAAGNYYSIRSVSGGNRGLHESSSQSHYIVSWAISANASKWYLDEVTLTEEQIATFEAEYHNEYGQYTTAAFLTFFEDAAATVLKSEYQSMSDTQLRTAMSGMSTVLQDIAIKVKNNSWTKNGWEKHFRVAKYGAFSNPDYWANRLNTFKYGGINNPTGIVANNGDKVFVIVGSDIPSGVTLKAETRCTPNVPGCTSTSIVPQSIVLKKGLNYLVCANDASHIYITYLSENGEPIAKYPELDIHVEGGSVHGYVDIKKHTDADWVSMKTAGLFQADDALNLLGNYAQLYLATSATTRNGDHILPLIEVYDWYVYTELDLMGITAVPDDLKDLPGAADAYEDLYPKYINNRMLCVGINNGMLHGGPGHICINGDGNFYYESLKERGSSSWGAAHEYGHVNQGAIMLLGTREVSNNLFSNAVLHKGGTCTSRGWSLNFMQGYMRDGVNNWPHIATVQYWCAPHMYYQLYLYYHAAGNDPLFYQKLFKLLRQSPLSYPAAGGTANGTQDYLHFALKACEAANEDLTSFFEYWGFFEPVSDVAIGDYVSGRSWTLTTTQEQIDDYKARMAAFSKKCNAAMIFIDDRAVASYKPDGSQKDAYQDFSVDNCLTDFPGAQYSAFTGERSLPQSMSYTLDGNYMTVANSEGAAGIKFYDESGKLIYVAAQDYFEIPMVVFNNIDHSKTVVALTDGTTLPLYETTDADKYLITIHHGNGETTTRYTKGGDGAMLDGARDGMNAIAMIEGENVPESISSATNVAVNNNFYHLSLTDAADFGVNTDATLKAASSRAASTDDLTADQVSYKDRKLWDGWNTACFPFAITTADLVEGAKLEVLDLQSTTEDVLYFTEVSEVAAGRPCLIYVPSVIDNWTLSKSGESGVGIPIKGRPEVTEANFYMNGSFTEKNIGAGHYKMNSTGTAFGVTTAAGMNYPFRAYISTTQVQGAARLSVEHGGTATGIALPTLTPDNNRLYDLQGRRITTPKRGVPYILNGQKVIFK